MLRNVILAATAGTLAVGCMGGAALAAGAHTSPYGHQDHIVFNTYFKEEVKVHKPGYGYVVTYKTCYYSKVFDSHGHPFVKKICD